MSHQNSHKLLSGIEIIQYDKHGKVKARKMSTLPADDKDDYIEVRVTDKKEKVVKDFQFPMRSYVRNFIRHMYARGHFTYAYGLQKIDGGLITSGLPGGQTIASQNGVCNAGINVNGGIVVGTGTGSITEGQYKLDDRIESGTGTGELVMGAMTLNTPVLEGGSYRTSMHKTYTNSSGGSITIRETGLYPAIYTVWDTYAFHIARDIINKDGNNIDVIVLDTQAIKFTYNYYFDVSQSFVKGLSMLYFNAYNNAASWSARSTSSGSIALGNQATHHRFDAPAAEDGYGIVVGTSDQAVDIDDWNMVAVVEEGTGAGQLEHSVISSTSGYETSGEANTFEVTRTFTNSSAGSITIKECGLVTRGGGGSTTRVLIARKLTGNLVTGPAESFTIRLFYSTTSA